MKSILERVEQTIKEHHLIEEGESILVAFSGGPDSTALLYLLVELRDKFRLTLSAGHLDHGLRAASARDREFCRKLCNQFGVKFHSKRLNIADF